MADLNIMPLYTDSYLADTLDLTTEQHGAYLLLLTAMWRAGGSLPNDPDLLARIVRMTPKKWAANWQVLSRFFTLGDDKIFQKRLRAEYEKASERKQKAVANGRAGGRPKSLKTQEAGKANGSDPVLQNESYDENSSKPDGKLSLLLTPYSEEEKKDDAPIGASSPSKSYAFEAGVIRLVAKDLEAWKRAYPQLNVEGELHALAEWAGRPENRKNWFHAIPAVLAKRDREARLAVAKHAASASNQQQMRMPDGII